MKRSAVGYDSCALQVNRTRALGQYLKGGLSGAAGLCGALRCFVDLSWCKS